MFFYGGRFFGHQEGGGGHAVRNKYSWGQMTREFPVTGEFKNSFYVWWELIYKLNAIKDRLFIGSKIQRTKVT